jgi:hypothetical protein
MNWALCIAAAGRKFKWFRREIRGNNLSRNLKKTPCRFNSTGGIHVIGKTGGTNGLGRAYRYELARLGSCGDGAPCSPVEAEQNFLILGQPKDYHRLLAQPPLGFRNGYRIGYLVTEFETPPQGWDFIFDIVHEIWTPSMFCANAIKQATEVPVKVVPYPVSVQDVPPMPRHRFGIDENHFLGMAIMDLSSCPERKHPLGHVKAWKLAFGSDPAAHLLMKARFHRHTRFARKELLEAIGDAQNIRLVEEDFDDASMCGFQRMADVYLSLHRAEGYGLNIHEMLEIGTPVIATGWSGNMDFMLRYPHATALPFKLVPYSDPTFQYQGEGLYWAEADIEAAASTLRSLKKCWDAARGSPRWRNAGAAAA